jgi:hypothetical protein
MIKYIFCSFMDSVLINSDHNNVFDLYSKMNLVIIKAKSKYVLDSKNGNESKER